ncbi:uncharacterized protein LOC134254868 [Saccostrea cucullata]|uniref:uncharacterized protein LOC134254868 n=1 Tax=Saccostrea cuccullata TaxID=36930 RepID=UPI002ED59F37
MYRFVLKKSVRVTGVSVVRHIYHITSDRVWICDRNNLILTNTKGDKLDHVTGVYSDYTGVHTVSGAGELIYIDSEYNINQLSKDNKVKTTSIKYNTAPWRPQCVYSSPSTGDLLVGMFRRDTLTGQVNRYNNTGRHIQTIQHSNTGQRLYECPLFITENRNGDVIVSDYDRGAVVVTDRVGRHRFTYTGPPSGSGLNPRGICTDAQSHILLCDYCTKAVQMIDKDGRFLSQFETEQHGIYVPRSLSYDCDTHLLWVGSRYNNTVNIYRLINEGDDLPGACIDDLDKANIDELKTFLRKEKTTVSHARGILVGCAGAGKTTLLKQLRGQSQTFRKASKSSRGLTTLLKRLRGQHQDVGEVTESTRGLEVHQHLFIVRDGILEG